MKKIVLIIVLIAALSLSVSALSFNHIFVEDINGGLAIHINIRNAGYDNTKILVVMPELDLYKRLGPLNSRSSSMSQKVFFDTPENVEPDFYLLRISATNNDGERKVVNRLVWVE